MKREQMLASLQRIFVLQYFKVEEIGPYGETIFEQCAWMDAYKFEQAVLDVVKTLKTNQRLKPAHFIAAYHRLAEEKGWTSALAFVCHSCGNARWWRIWVKDKKGVEMQAVKGCGECNQRYAQVHPDFTEIEGPTFQSIDPNEVLRNVGPFYAEALIDMAEACKIQLKPSQLDALLESANKPRPASIHPLRKVNAAKRKNELVLALVKAAPVKDGGAESEASVGNQPADVVEAVSSAPPLPPTPELSPEDLADIPF